jgi:hypothetical protein
MERAVRRKIEAKNPNHNLWKNGNLWWICFTTYHPNLIGKRTRYSLGTKDLEYAKILRDMIFHDLNIKNADENK